MSQNTITSKVYMPLAVSFYERTTDVVAADLIGRLLVRETTDGVMTARIVEVEAYFGEGDPASHACRGMTPRNSIMFGRAGRAYVYLNYGVHYLLNAVTGREGCAGAVLIRAVEPVAGIDRMLENRPVKNLVELTNGPGKLTKALHIDMRDNGVDMTAEESDLYIANGAPPEPLPISVSPRVGISSGKDMLLRFFVDGNPYVSKK